MWVDGSVEHSVGPKARRLEPLEAVSLVDCWVAARVEQMVHQQVAEMVVPMVAEMVQKLVADWVDSMVA